nr:energy transducer TonB [Cognaticolwellia beringensis]
MYRVEPKYPAKAAAESIEGSVVLKFDIDRTGMVKNVEVVNGSPAYVFDKVAKTALEQWQYEPSNSYHKNNLVQLDFAMNENSAKRESLIEQVKVTK